MVGCISTQGSHCPDEDPALDYGRDNIQVHCLCQGITDTPMLQDHLGDGPQGEANIRACISPGPLGSILNPKIWPELLFTWCQKTRPPVGVLP